MPSCLFAKPDKQSPVDLCGVALCIKAGTYIPYVCCTCVYTYICILTQLELCFFCHSSI